MEKKHMHVQHNRLVSSGYLGTCRGSEKCFHLSVILFFGLFSICLLIGLLVANVQYNDAKSQLTKDLQDYKNKLSSTTKDRDQLFSFLNGPAKEQSNLAKQNIDSKCNSNEELLNNLTERLHACNETLFKITKERDYLNIQLVEQPEEASGLQSLSEQNDSKCNLNVENELSTLSDNLTARLRDSGETISFISQERDLLNVKLGKTTKELKRLCQLIENTTCPKGWIKFNCSCYNIFGTGSWDEGREDCISKGGDLVVIDNPDEQNFLSTFKIEAWIGLGDKETEESWRWVDGTSLNFTFWDDSQPNKGKEDEEDCVLVTTNDGAPWHDFPCNAVSAWICEKLPIMFIPKMF
ncbi:C-type lectin domain family 4 member G-like isoform X1 [Girardinichthys multiradiatus]|uniref:C-type lectin domain family 4 member G-like isoform X1 n=1 Tax=Girardinichthys multiradiatus TaxID=208333 RepID=UPI001FAB4CA4|nr:C-type lectin domain family 4 member G-like isoform X1 [Girardinichthys multiradiatus]